MNIIRICIHSGKNIFPTPNIEKNQEGFFSLKYLSYSLVFVTQGVKINIHICIRIICLLQIIFVFVHQKNYWLHSGSALIIHPFLAPHKV